MSPRGPEVIVVGAGIVGASIAYHLARDGARVTMVEAGHRPAMGVTGRSFGWLNLVNIPVLDEDPTYNLRRTAIADFHRLEKDLRGRLKIDWCGGLVWRETGEKTEALAAYHEARGTKVERMGPGTAVGLEPGLANPPALSIYSGEEGAVDPAALTETLLAAAREHGAALRYGTRVAALGSNGAKVTGVQVGRWLLRADHVVLAAGAESGRLAASVGINLPIETSNSVLLRLGVPRQPLRGIVCCPTLEARPAGPHTLLLAEDYLGSAPEYRPDAMARRMAHTVAEFFRDMTGIEPLGGSVGARPIPADGLPAIGAAPGLSGVSVAVMHPGVILGPLVGKHLAGEILREVREPTLDAYRPSRF